MLPNPFEKPLPKMRETDPLKNEEIVRELLGERGVHKYRKILGDNSNFKNKKDKEVSKEDLLALAAEANALKEQAGKISAEAFEATFEKSLERQYVSQIKSLEEIRFLDTKNGDLGFTAITGYYLKIPNIEDIKNHFLSIPNIQEKVRSGFTRLLIVPFGRSLDTLRQKTKSLIMKHERTGRLLKEGGGATIVQVNDPMNVWDRYDSADISGGLVYYPELFDKNKHNGKTKAELLSHLTATDPFLGYHVLLIQEDTKIPSKRNENSPGEMHQLKVGETPDDYLALLNNDPEYANERGLTPEDWPTLFATNLDQTDTVINDVRSGVDHLSLLLGSFLPDYKTVLRAGWDSCEGRLNLFGTARSADFESAGASTAVC